MAAARPVTRKFTVDKSGLRLDQFLAGQPTGLTRSQLQRLIGDGLALLNGNGSKASSKVRRGDRITLTVPPPKPTEIVPQWMPLTVVYQDEHIAVIDKPAGLAVHPGPGHSGHTLVNALLAICPDIQGVGGEIRPGIVHRLDKDTSGLMVVAKTHQAHLDVSSQIKARQVDKGYIALAVGKVEPAVGVIDEPIGRDPHHRKRMAVVPDGREARTRYRVLEYIVPSGGVPIPSGGVRMPSGGVRLGYSLLEVVLETGRTHQIRVHLSFIGHPLMGDGVYGRSSPLLDRQFLHANRLGFRHPATGEPVEFRSELPPELSSVLDRQRDG
jgi:23S rRNA pseudouridine1911/1915/1917 synthase